MEEQDAIFTHGGFRLKYLRLSEFQVRTPEKAVQKQDVMQQD